MRIVKHGLLSLMRKPTKAGMIFVILFIVFSLVFTGVIIQNSIDKSREFIRTQLGAVVEYKADYNKAYKDNISDEAYEQLELSKNAADLIAEDKRVEKVYVNRRLDLVSKKYKNASNTNGMVMNMSSSFSGEGEGEESYFDIKATEGGPTLEFDKGKLTIEEGRNINASDEQSSENPIVISKDFATKNEVVIGDELTFSSYLMDGKIKFNVVGIFKSTDGVEANDTMFTSAKAITTDQVGISNIFFKLNDPLQVTSFIKDQSSNLPSEYMTLDANSSEYKKLTKPLDLVSMITSILIWVIFIAGACIIVSLITIFVRDRKFEIGLLLSSGEAKHKIVSQFIIEIAIVAIIAFACSVLLSYQISNGVSQWIVDNQLIEQEDDYNYDDYVVVDDGSMVENDFSIKNVANDFNVSMTFKVIQNLFFVSLCIVLIASLIPILIILSFNPRQALQD